MKKFEDLEVYKKAFNFSVAIFKKKINFNERHSLFQ